MASIRARERTFRSDRGLLGRDRPAGGSLVEYHLSDRKATWSSGVDVAGPDSGVRLSKKRRGGAESYSTMESVLIVLLIGLRRFLPTPTGSAVVR